MYILCILYDIFSSFLRAKRIKIYDEFLIAVFQHTQGYKYIYIYIYIYIFYTFYFWENTRLKLLPSLFYIFFIYLYFYITSFPFYSFLVTIRIDQPPPGISTPPWWRSEYIHPDRCFLGTSKLGKNSDFSFLAEKLVFYWFLERKKKIRSSSSIHIIFTHSFQ